MITLNLTLTLTRCTDTLDLRHHWTLRHHHENPTQALMPKCPWHFVKSSMYHFAIADLQLFMSKMCHCKKTTISTVVAQKLIALRSVKMYTCITLTPCITCAVFSSTRLPEVTAAICMLWCVLYMEYKLGLHMPISHTKLSTPQIFESELTSR